MSRRPSPLSLACCVSLSLAVSFLAAGAARAQDQRKSILPSIGEAGFTKAYGSSTTGPQSVFKGINRPNEGEKASKDKEEHRTAIDMAAQFYTYRLTWPINETPGEVDKLMTEFFAQVTSADSDAMRKENPAFSEMYLKALALKARDVVQTQQPIAAVNAARMLARLARVGVAEAGDACLDVVKNDKDFLEPKARLGAQYWAFQGLGSLLARWEEPTPAGAAAPDKDRQAKYVAALVAAIEQFIPADGKASAAAAPGTSEERGLQMFRREAVRALAQYRGPGVAGDKGAVKVKSALTLLKVMNNDGLAPPARLDEQIEATWGVARLRSKALASYQPDYAAQQIGPIVVAMAAGAKPDKNFPWKYHAARLADALEVLRADTKGAADKAAAAYVDAVVSRSLQVLKDIEVKSQAGAADFKVWLRNNPSPHDTLYTGVADSKVRPLEREDAPAPEKPGDKKPDDKKPGDKKPDGKRPDDKKPGDKKPDDKKPGDKPSK